ncbi:hypothetical protein MXB_4382 [Myxobolus squamalis]|nr:hypothetical protein MXB_4382 [Myxobolus squamalis]
MFSRNVSTTIPKDKIELKIGHYAIGENLGSGKFGIVKIGYHRLTNHVVAIKIVSRKLVKGVKIVDKVSREMVVLYHLHHPHVVKLF